MMNKYKINPLLSLCILNFWVPYFFIWLKQCAFTFTVPLINKPASQGSILINMNKNPYACILIILFTYSCIITLFSSVCCQKISSYLISYKIFPKKVRVLKSEKRKRKIEKTKKVERVSVVAKILQLSLSPAPETSQFTNISCESWGYHNQIDHAKSTLPLPVWSAFVKGLYT